MPRVIGLLLEDADFGLSADEADIELGPLHDDPRADRVAMIGAAIQAHSTRPIVRKTSQFSGTRAIKYAARQSTTKSEPGTSTPAASRRAMRAASAVALKSFHAPRPPALVRRLDIRGVVVGWPPLAVVLVRRIGIHR